ncbi:GNAT family N-acetyltransferase [Lutibaculum baratangense]|uniref:Putative ribosomal-protein-serine acetyltransferase n=1 Tax=Lutibaculum baratangense AMV1 TaxID=631454 RepID=V4RGV2_9HYPH|nr:GNAT family protein [Lutibaculum baratangense]ESR24599.1 putative ribosomal-protein-serine acetyltransferase [Lutibaculum baratangense AMV1]
MSEPLPAENVDPAFEPRPRPPRDPIEGRTVRLEAFDVARHARHLFDAFQSDAEGHIWDYLAYGPFPDLTSYVTHARRTMVGRDPFFHAIVDKATERPTGVAALMRIVPEHGVIEVGHLCYGPALQRTVQATEAQYLLMRRVFEELGYRRYEWKCNAENEASMRAAERLGFRYEGTFRKHMVVKGRNRDTAWFSITDDEWPQVKQALEAWLSPQNFDAEGQQRSRLMVWQS